MIFFFWQPIVLYSPGEKNAVLKKKTVIKCSYSGTSINYNEWPRDCQNLFTITRFCYIAVLFRIFYHHWGKKYRLLYRGLLLDQLYRSFTVILCNDFLLTCMPLKKEKQIHTNLLFQILLNNSRDSFNRFCKTNIIIMFIQDIYFTASKLIIHIFT